MDGGKRCENAYVDVNTFVCFQETENGGFRKRISLDGALVWRKALINMEEGRGRQKSG